MNEPAQAITALLALMARLRDPVGGCPWDREQSFATIAPHTLEEAYEVVDAIEREDAEALRGELGDLLFQVVFHARMAEERGWFDFAAVAGGIHEKLVRRHPHVFGDAQVKSAAEQTARWEETKARERAASRSQGGDASTLADVPRGLPALTRAAKLGRRAATVGFDWPNAAAVRDKVNEELHELDTAISQGNAAHVTEELGDLLFAMVNWSRHLGTDAESALRAASAKFETRFRAMEALVAARGLRLDALSAAQWDALWTEAKAGAGSMPDQA